MPDDPLFPPSSHPESNAGAGADPFSPNTLPKATPPAEPTGFSPLAEPTLTDSGLTPNVAAGLAVLLTLITGILFLFLEKRNQFVRFWAMQAVFFGAAWLVFSVVSSVVSAVLGHILWLLAGLWLFFSLLVNVGFLIVWVVMLAKAFGGKEWEVPYLGKLARQQLTTLPRG